MQTSNVTAATAQSQLQPEPENFLSYRTFPKHNTAKDFDGLLSGGAFAVIAFICLAIGALVLLT